MNRVIIVDDKIGRQKPLLTEEAEDRLNYLKVDGVLSMATCVNDLNELNQFDLIAMHESYINELNIYDDIVRYVKSNNKFLILFSGGTSQTVVFDERLISVSTEKLYNQELPEFINKFSVKKDRTSLLKFVYGNSWKLALLTQYRFLLWNYGDVVYIYQNEQDSSKFDEIESLLWPEHNAPQDISELDDIIANEYKFNRK